MSVLVHRKPKAELSTEMKIKNSTYSNIIAAFCNLALAFVIYMLCRVAYVWENWQLFAPGWKSLSFGSLLHGSLRFDGSAIFYTNALYLLLMLLPFSIVQRRWWQRMSKTIYLAINSLAVAINLCDAVYSQFSGRRTTASFFHEFEGEDNLTKIFFTEVVNHWYLVLAAAAIIALLFVLYVNPSDSKGSKSWKSTLGVRITTLVMTVALAIVAMRGGIVNTYRPLTLADANRYVNQPHEAAIVLNTPFTLIRTIGKTTFESPHYYDSTTLESIYTPLHSTSGSTTGVGKRKNVVVLIVESFGREYIGFYNHQLEDGAYKGYTPFVDSLLSHSLTWQTTLANGRKSIDAMPSILSSIPMFVEPFFMTGYAQNSVGGLAYELRREGYSSAFFHGANNGSMAFDNFARATGWERYYGRNEYNDDPRFGGDNDFDGTWAIWDEPFLQFFATKMSEMEQPFVTALFTASSHHPFALPDQYKTVFQEEELPIHKCIRYTDNALRRFFETASRQPWFENTIFVLTSDHTNMSNHDLYRTSIGLFSAPILIYDPSGELQRGIYPGVAQQIDIMPTLLGILGYGRPFIAFGKDLLAGTESQPVPDNTWAVNYNNGIYQYLENDTLIQFDGEKVTASYNINTDPLMLHPLPSHPTHHEKRLKAIIQQYMSRMIEDRLIPNQSFDN